MTLFQIIQVLKEIALTQPNVKTATDGSIYDVMNTNPSVKYDVVHFSQTTHQSDEETDFYGLNIFYVSRLEDSLEDNRLQIQSIGKEVLDNIIRTFCENWGIDFPVITYTPFTQKFNDLCAGCYCNLRLEIPKEIICADDYVAEVVPGSGIKLQDIAITITENGLRVITADAEYDGIGEVRIVTDVPQAAGNFQDKEVEYTENGSYVVRPDPSYDALTSVSVDVLVPDNYDKGYEDGKEDGAEEQKAKLTVTSFTENNTYTRENGWSAVTVDVPSDYQDGYADGVADQKAKMVATAITENGEYGRPDGYSAVTVDVPDRYNEGFFDGIDYQKSLLVSTAFTENGGYASENGYSVVYVEVPQTGSSNEDLKANLENRYFLIPDGTSHLRDGAFYRTCFQTITIPSSVSAIGMYGFAQNQCLTSITIPDTVLSIGTYCFSGDTNLESVYLGTGLTEIPSYALAACPSLTGVTFPATITGIGTSIFNSGNTGLEEITFEGLVPPTLASTGNSLGPTGFTFPIYVPCQSIDAYKTAFGTRYATRIQCRQEEMITALTLNVATAITDSGTATTTYSPASATTDIRYTSSNPSIATIDPNTGVITVVANGTVTICALDRISGLEDCKSITVTKTPPQYKTLHFVYSTTTSNERVIFYDVNNLPASTNFEIQASNSTRSWVNNLVSMEIDGVEVQTTSAYTFATPGKHIVKYNSPVGTVPDFLFSLSKNPHPASSAQNEKLVEAHIGEGFGVLLNNAFDGDINLTAVTLPNSMKVLGNSPFRNTGIKSIVIPDSVTANTSITDYRPYANRYVNNSEDNYWFSGCTSLSSVTIGTGVTVVPVYCFEGCTSLTDIVVPNNVTRLCDGAFKGCYSLTGVTIPTNLTGIGSSTFLTTDLVSAITLPNTLKTIGTWAFSNVGNVKNITFGTGIESIGSNAFYYTPITGMTFNGTTPPVLGNQSALGPNNRAGFKIYVPSSAVASYKSAWPYYTNNIVAKP